MSRHHQFVDIIIVTPLFVIASSCIFLSPARLHMPYILNSRPYYISSFISFDLQSVLLFVSSVIYCVIVANLEYAVAI